MYNMWQDAGIRTRIAATAARCATNELHTATENFTHPTTPHPRKRKFNPPNKSISQRENSTHPATPHLRKRKFNPPYYSTSQKEKIQPTLLLHIPEREIIPDNSAAQTSKQTGRGINEKHLHTLKKIFSAFIHFYSAICHKSIEIESLETIFLKYK